MKLYAFHEEKHILPIKVYDEDLNWLVDNGYILQEEKEVVLTEKGKEIFELSEDLFEQFFELFPHKVPDGTWRHLNAGAELNGGEIFFHFSSFSFSN